MIIYSNNLHEKLQGIAISKDYLKYNTPFCDLVDNPEWEVDINLALNYHKGSYGNLDAANKFVQDLTLNSNKLDWATVEYYTHKIKYNPAFRSAIKEMRARWSTPDLFSDDFQNTFNNALKDCLNSPCNLFTETSDSIGRMAQSASTKTTANTFGVGELSASFVNMINGLDETITNKLPAVFKNAFTEVTAVASKAWENTQAVLAGKENLSTFYQKVRDGKSFRDPADSFRYSPDVQSYYDYSEASSNVLAAIKIELGGCFNRFQHRFRYNPYDATQNQKSPLGTKTDSVNGIDTDENSLGQPRRYSKRNSVKIADQTDVVREGFLPVNPRQSDDFDISDTYTITPTGRDKYTIFAAFVDSENKVIYTDPWDGGGNPNDLNTLGGLGNIGANYAYAPSKINKTNKGIQILKGQTVKDHSIEIGTVAGNIASGWRHEISDEGMETLYDRSQLTYNDGVAVSQGLLARYLNTPQIKLKDTGIHKDQLNNEAFIAVRPVGRRNWKYYKIIDLNSQSNINLDFTVGAWQHFLNSFYGGKKVSIENAKQITDTGWVEVKKYSQNDITDRLELKICRGNIENIKNTINSDLLTVSP